MSGATDFCNQSKQAEVRWAFHRDLWVAGEGEWASKYHLSVNRGFLNTGDVSQRAPKAKKFTLGTVFKLIEKFHAFQGNIPVPIHGLDIYQPRALTPIEYVAGLEDADKVYTCFLRVLESSSFIHLDHALTLQEAKKIFNQECESLGATDEERAQACEAMVVKTYRTEKMANAFSGLSFQDA